MLVGWRPCWEQFSYFNVFKYASALPNIQIGNENLKFGYEIAQVLLKTPSIASCIHEPSFEQGVRKRCSMTKSNEK